MPFRFCWIRENVSASGNCLFPVHQLVKNFVCGRFWKYSSSPINSRPKRAIIVNYSVSLLATSFWVADYNFVCTIIGSGMTLLFHQFFSCLAYVIQYQNRKETTIYSNLRFEVLKTILSNTGPFITLLLRLNPCIFNLLL